MKVVIPQLATYARHLAGLMMSGRPSTIGVNERVG